MNPWSHDAGQLNPEEIPDAYIFKNENIRNYLEPSAHERKLFLVGPKGCGKTLLLRYKAYQYWRKLENDPSLGYSVSASKDLVESLSFSMVQLSRSDLGHLESIENWVRIWNFALVYLILKKAGIPLPSRLSDIDDRFEGLNNLSVIVGEIINHPQEFLASRFFAKTNALMGKLDELQNVFVMFIDRLDQALITFLTSKDYNYLLGEKDEVQPFHIWRNAQFGLLQACYGLNTARNRHIKIFATAREEALDVPYETVANISSYCVPLDYTHEELRIIFEQNIRNTPKERLRGNSNTNIWERFFGFDALDHLKVKDVNGKPRREHVFDFLIRHSFERPRELLRLGRAVYLQIVTRNHQFRPADGDHKELVRRVVNNCAYEEILKDYQKEFIPYFREEHVDTIAKAFNRNLISLEQTKEVDAEVIDYLYRIGLLGCAKQGRQVFVSSSKFIYDDKRKVPVTDYYLLHPTLDRRMQMEHHYDDFYNESNIIGNGRRFYPPEIYTPELENSVSIEYYLPKKTPGDGSELNNQIVPDRYVLYPLIFQNDDDPTWRDLVHDRIKKVFRSLSIIGQIWCTIKISQAFKADFESYQKNLNGRLGKLEVRSDYTKIITLADHEGCEQFLCRIFGRMVTAGLLLYTDLSPEEIHHLIRHFHYSPGASVISTEGAVKYFRKAFFLDGLSYHYPIREHEREKLRQGLSDFEQKYLQRWWINFVNHDMMVNDNFNDDHYRYLEQLTAK